MILSYRLALLSCKADKGGGIVIKNKDFYKRKMLEILQDTKFYKPTTSKCSKQTFTKIRKLIKDADEITRHEINYLLEFDCNTSLFYGLPKIHKSIMMKEKCKATSGEYLELLDPEDLTFRPIVAGTTCETHRLSNMIYC